MSPAAPLPIKYTSTCQEDQRLSLKAKSFQNTATYQKLLGAVPSPPPPPLPRLLFQGRGKNLRVRPGVKKNQLWEFTQSETEKYIK